MAAKESSLQRVEDLIAAVAHFGHNFLPSSHLVLSLELHDACRPRYTVLLLHAGPFQYQPIRPNELARNPHPVSWLRLKNTMGQRAERFKGVATLACV